MLMPFELGECSLGALAKVSKYLIIKTTFRNWRKIVSK